MCSIATKIELATRKYLFDLLKTTLQNMAFKVDNHFGTKGVPLFFEKDLCFPL